MKLFFLIPVYNEAENLDKLHASLSELKLDYEKTYVFVDDCSTDESVSKIQYLFRNESLTIIKKERNYGPGHSFNLGFERILMMSSSQDDLIITMEADNTSDLKLLPKMVSISQLGYNLVLASVYSQGGGFDKTSLFRRVVSFIGNSLFRILYSIKVSTLSSFYRVYHVTLVQKIKRTFNTPITEDGFISMLEILLKAIRVDAEIIEVPMILCSQNRSGKSKMKVLNTILSYLGFLWRKGRLINVEMVRSES